MEQEFEAVEVHGAKRVHELFQTHEQAKLFPDHVYSDHLPILVEVPIATSKKPIVGEEPLKIISWNVLAPGNPSGLHAPFWREEETVANERASRIIQSLKTKVEKHQPDMIVLQEAPVEYYNALLSKFPGYSIEHAKGGLITLYRPRTSGGRLTLKAYESNNDVMLNGKIMGNRQTFLFKVNGRRHVRIDNIYGRFYPTPQHHEGYFRQRLNEVVPRKGVINVVVGDTNSRIAPEDRTPQNIVTGVVPSMFNEQSGVGPATQMTDFPDAAFVRGDDKVIRQLPRHILSPTNGDIFVPVEAPAVDLKPQWHQSRMIMCLTDFNRPEDLIGVRNVFEYQAHLEHYFPNSGILVRLGAKDNNARDFGFQFSKDAVIYKHIERILGEELDRQPSNGIEQIFVESGMGQAPIIFVRPDKMPEFLAVINPVIQALQSIDMRIENLRSSWINPFLRSGQPKIDLLNALRTKILAEIGEKPLADIVQEWEDQDGTAVTMAEKRNRFVGTFFYRSVPPAAETENLVGTLKNSPRGLGH